MDKQNSECMTNGPWYNTYICKKLHGTEFEGSIRNTITDRYHIMCCTFPYEKEHKSSCGDGSRNGGCPLSSNLRT